MKKYISKIIISLLFLYNISYAEEVSLNTLKVAYVYDISTRGIYNYKPTSYCINNDDMVNVLKSANKPIVVDNEYFEGCEVLFNYYTNNSLTFTDNYDERDNYMFYLELEDEHLIIFRNSKLTRNLNIKSKYLDLMEVY